MSDVPIKLQRDWLGHGIQFIGIVVAFGAILAPFAIYLNTTAATQAASQATLNATLTAVASRLERDERDILEQRQDQRLVTQNLIDVTKTLTRIDAQLEGIREQKPKR